MGERETVVVVGAGGAGCLAALRLASRGVSVALLERAPAEPSLTAICGGLIPAVGTRQQAAAGVEDSIDRFAADVMAKNHGQADLAMVREVAAVSAAALEFIAEATGAPLHLYTDILHPGLSVPRLHATAEESGHHLQDLLRRAIGASAQVRRIDGVAATGLLRDAAGLPAGVAGRGPQGSFELRADRVVLATGGFGANRAMVARYIPSMAAAEHVGSRSSTGELIEAAIALGADTAHMSGFQGHCHVNVGGRSHLGGSLPRLGAIMVNRDGRRFGAEDAGYSEFALTVLAQPGGIAIEIFDQWMFDRASSLGVFREAVEAGEVRRADDAAGLAALFDIDAAGLEAELAAWDEAVRLGRDPVWGRTIMPRRLEPPLYGSRVTGALAHTQGGLRIDGAARVLDRTGRAIPHLFAIGGAAACFSGDGAEGYLSGNGLVHAFGTAWLAAEHIAATLSR